MCCVCRICLCERVGKFELNVFSHNTLPNPQYLGNLGKYEFNFPAAKPVLNEKLEILNHRKLLKRRYIFIMGKKKLNHGVIEKVALLVFLGFDTEFISRSINVQSKFFGVGSGKAMKRRKWAYAETSLMRSRQRRINALKQSRVALYRLMIRTSQTTPKIFNLISLSARLKTKKPDHRDPTSLLGKIYKANIL